jgi:DNA-binding MurR/RpiR family transcriptional regulator
MFRERIQDKYDQLTPSFRKLADFILQRQLDAAFMTATELANRLGVDAATVVRFAQNLGYSGFRELIKEVQQVVKEELTTSYSPDLSAPDDVGVFRSLLENERHNLALAQAQLTEQANTILPTLLEAKQVWVLGQGHGFYLAGLCASVFRELGLPAVAIASDPLEAAQNLKRVGPEDAVVGFSLTGMDLTVADAVKFARERGAKTIVFTASTIAAPALAAETTVTCPGPTKTHMPSFAGLAAMISVLAAGFMARYPEQAEGMTEDLKQSFRDLLGLQTASTAEIEIEELWRQF